VWRRRAVPLGVLCLGLLCMQWPRAVAARTMQRLFEPTDLEFEDPGMVELDTQFGPVRGQDAHRIVVPDVELDVGLTHNIEFDVDGQFAIGGPDTGEFTFNRVAPDNLWPSIKLGVLDFADPSADTAWSFGLQVGPKLPLAHGARGVGFEGLTLLGYRYHQTYLILNFGGLHNPAASANTPSPSGPEMGLDLDHPLDQAGHWALIAQIGAVVYTSPDPDQLTTTAGIAWRPNENLELSIVGLYGWLSGGDRYGVLFGFSPKFRLW
jgi:hypothetical protein